MQNRFFDRSVDREICGGGLEWGRLAIVARPEVRN